MNLRPWVMQRRLRSFSPRFMGEKNPLGNAYGFEVLEDGQTQMDLGLKGEILERMSSSQMCSARTLILNRPKALNALSASMCDRLFSRMSIYESTDLVTTAILRTLNSKAFCAGGDIRLVAESAPEIGDAFFRKEYRLNRLLGSLKTTTLVSMMEGITMGGGAGISVHGPYRIVTEKTMFAMPECMIGLVPDVGTSYVLSRLPYNFGNYLALTGARLNGAAVAAVGLGTHLVPSHQMDALENEITESDTEREGLSKKLLEQILSQYTEPVARIEDYPNVSVVNHCFGQSSVEAIVAELEKISAEGSVSEECQFAQEALNNILAGSPISVKLAFEELRRGREKTLTECLQMEFCLVTNLIREPDFYEGVRAALIDKDKNPKWSLASLSEVGDLEKYFRLPKGVRGLFEENEVFEQEQIED